jgi:hypothetical protein|tara:strand:- start:7977 stop:9050 length:1074 start_codon:yes stop_codon:yes gene_type:complete
MQIQRSRFNLNDVDRYGTGAGIIPIAQSSNGEFFLLLGRERFLPQWKGSCRWSGFEGSRKINESLKDTAVREFTEESLGVVFEKISDIENIINNKEYWTRVVLRISNDKKAERYHTTYTVLVSLDTDLVDKFSKRRAGIENLDRLSREMERAFPTFALLNGYEVELGNVNTIEDGSIELFRHVGKETEHEWAAGTKEGFYTRCLEAQEEDISDDEDDSIVWESAGDSIEKLKLSPEHPYTARIKIWEDIRNKLETSKSCQHPCVTTRKGSVFGRIQDLRVHTDHLEKDQIRWWSSTDLRRVLDSRGYLGNDCFRPYFLPVLQTVLHELSHSPPDMSITTTVESVLDEIIDSVSKCSV